MGDGLLRRREVERHIVQAHHAFVLEDLEFGILAAYLPFFGQVGRDLPPDGLDLFGREDDLALFVRLRHGGRELRGQVAHVQHEAHFVLGLRHGLDDQRVAHADRLRDGQRLEVFPCVRDYQRLPRNLVRAGLFQLFIDPGVPVISPIAVHVADILTLNAAKGREGEVGRTHHHAFVAILCREQIEFLVRERLARHEESQRPRLDTTHQIHLRFAGCLLQPLQGLTLIRHHLLQGEGHHLFTPKDDLGVLEEVNQLTGETDAGGVGDGPQRIESLKELPPGQRLRPLEGEAHHVQLPLAAHAFFRAAEQRKLIFVFMLHAFLVNFTPARSLAAGW